MAVLLTFGSDSTILYSSAGTNSSPLAGLRVYELFFYFKLDVHDHLNWAIYLTV